MKFKKLWEDNEPWQGSCASCYFLGESNSKYPQSNRINLIKRTTWILPCVVCDTPITGACTFYTDASKSGKEGYKSEDLSRV